MPILSLSVFFPAYNEQDIIASTVQKAVEVLKSLKLEWEIIVVDDGSKDETGRVADELAAKNSRIRVIHQQNGGYGSALRAGFGAAKYDWVVYSDSDGQFDFSEVRLFIEKAEEADYILGYRIKRSDPFYRAVFAKVWALSVFSLFWIWVNDIDCGFKMISKQALREISPLQSQRGAMINAELLIKSKRAGFRIAQVGVHHYPRLAGSPTGASLRVIVKSYLDLLNLWFKTI